jgi:hypothetical protein
MRKYSKTIIAWDCGDDRCCHVSEKYAITCRDKRREKEKKEKKGLLMFKDYMTTRININMLAKKHGVSRRTINYRAKSYISHFYSISFSEERKRKYGTDLTLQTAVNKHSSFWAKLINKKLEELEV